MAGHLAITEQSRAAWTLAGACMGMFMLMLDSTTVAIALPQVRRDLGASTSELQWVLNGYLLAIAVLVVTAGRIGDMAGRRRLFLIGVAIFFAGLVIAATAPSIEVLVAARIVQGIGAAPMLTLSLALVSEAYDEARRPRALAIWAGVSAAALAIGPLLGGALVEAASWRWVFWAGVAPLALAFAITLLAARESRDPAAGHRVDVAGLAALTVGVTGIVLALVEGEAWGWGSTRTLGVAAVGVAGVVAFCAIEPRVRSPIVEFGLFRNGPYLGASAAAFCLVGVYWAVIFFVPQYLQDVLGYGDLESGLLVLPATAPMAAISPSSARIVERVGVRALMTFGMACGTLGVALLTRIDGTSGYGTLLPGLLLFGVALGCVYAPMSAAAMAAMPHAKAGIAAGVLAMNRILSGALVLAATAALVAAIDPGGGAGVSAEADAAARAAYADALADALWFSVALLAMGTLLTWLLVRAPRAAADSAPAPNASTSARARRA